MSLSLYNTLTRRKEKFEPLDRSNVRMYVCGPTVYDYAHIGNARPVIVFDVLYRLLRHVYGEKHVTYARNITDVDDKIIVRAREEYPDRPLNKAIAEVTQKTEKQFHEDMAALGCLKPDIEPRATAHIPQMIAMIEQLIAKGHAYAAEAHVLFDVTSMRDYGKLAGRSTDEMIAGARVEVAPYKKNPMDFVLWKPSSEEEPGWESPWGRGRPGWHIECSAMSDRWLWTEAKPSLSEAGLRHPHQFDIHGGGIDLVFPHHENEIAQSRCANGTEIMAKVWMHNGYLQVEGEKMSKSLGNFVTVHELLQDWPGEVIRFNMLRTHYHQPMDWTVRGLEESEKTLDEWYALSSAGAPTAFAETKSAVIDVKVLAALGDDLNTPKAIAALHQLRNAAVHGKGVEHVVSLIQSLRFLGFLSQSDQSWRRFRQERTKTDPAVIDNLIRARNAARKAKNFEEADRIRDELAAMGVALKDGPQGTTWEIMR